jgi:hypothetical protein
MNDIKLQEGHPIDENLRPLKVGDKSSSLELADTDNGARVRGDLEITGSIPRVKTNRIVSHNLYIADDTSIYMDSRRGEFYMLENGREFSSSGSAYAGMILGYTRIQNDGTNSPDNVISLTTTMTVLQTASGTDVGVTFVAPPSGNVEIQFSCYFYSSSTTVGFALSDNASFNEVDETHTYDQGAYRMDETDSNTINIPFAVTGLTSGTEYTYYIGAEEVIGSTAKIYHGRFRLTGSHYPPIIVKAIALPDTIRTGE